MGFLQKLLRMRSVTKDATIAVLGPSKAGKTTLVQFLETGEPQETAPLSTLGIDSRNDPVKFDSWNLKILDVGGQKMYQDAFWQFSIEQAQGVIYVIDSTITPKTNPEAFNAQISQYGFLLSIIPEDTVLMILLNKQDIESSDKITPDNFSQYYPLDNLVNRSFAFLPTSAKFGNGVEEAFKWFIEKMNQISK
ncbi:MAG: ADP-ribosylation factor-like protein [Candidatus Heimdallarchaeota archaeon]|nr:ADP-ribosylation factor-like protein [Candidatus Heimdallarchaeota archaeon]MDH5647607.1 ADP-ribosylation factor-like protein [Candidatus Heimdallarchaeota archaeon]